MDDFFAARICGYDEHMKKTIEDQEKTIKDQEARIAKLEALLAAKN